MKLNVNKMDRIVTILRANISKDGFNADITTWLPIASDVWAEAEPVNDAERLRAGEVLASKQYRFRIRFSPEVADVDSRDRIRYDGRIYDINGVKEIGRAVGLEITATARADAKR